MEDRQGIDRTAGEREETSTTSRNPPEPLRGRHLAPGRRYPNRWLVILGVLPVVLVAVLLVRMIGAGQESKGQSATATTLDVLGPPPTPPAGPAAFGNLVSNWSFEQDLRGWRVVGPATASQQPQGRTSGSSAAVRASGGQPQRVGLVLLKVVPSARRGSRYVASAWVRSSPPGLKVTLRLVATGGGGAWASEAVATTLPGDRWGRVTVAHRIAAAQASLDLQIMAAEVGPGEVLLIDEVELRSG
jgi:Carbohydrate binding domain